VRTISPAKVAAICFIFLTVLFFTSGLDLAMAAVLISLVFLFRLPSAWLFICAFFTFAIYLILNFLALKLNYITDLTISSYGLFVAGLVLYFWQGQKKKWQLILPFTPQVQVTRMDLFKLGGILVFVFLIYPLVSAYLAAILGYILFLIIFRQSDGRYAFAVALFFLILCPFLLIARKDKIAETSAIFTYYFLVIGVIQELISLVREPKAEEEVEEVQVIKPESLKEEAKLSHLGRLQKLKLSGEKTGFRHFPNVFLAGILSFLATSGIFYIIMRSGIPTVDYFTKKQIKYSPVPSVISTISPKPSITLIPASVAKMTTESARMKILIQNGTEVTGLAASTASQLKKAGFVNVSFNNASRRDYLNWEFASHEKKDDLSQLIKNILKLDELRSSEATVPAGFEVLIIAGREK